MFFTLFGTHTEAYGSFTTLINVNSKKDKKDFCLSLYRQVLGSLTRLIA